jgi:hypothetical protein
LFEESGHFYTVYVVARLADFGHDSAMSLAAYTQILDEVEAFDAAFMGLKHRNSTWKGAADAVGTDKAELNDYWEEVVQQALHQLHGGDEQIIKRNRAILTDQISGALRAEDYKKAGIYLHAFGDSYAHTYVDNGKRFAFGTRVGHALAKGPASGDSQGGHAVDYIRERYADGIYPKYVRDLAKLLGVPAERQQQIELLIEELRPSENGKAIRESSHSPYFVPNNSTEEIRRLRNFGFGDVSGIGYSYESAVQVSRKDYRPEDGLNPIGELGFGEMRSLARDLFNKMQRAKE